MTYQVTVPNKIGETYYLKKTVFTSAQETATTFETVDQAQAAIEKAGQFHPKKTMKQVEIITI